MEASADVPRKRGKGGRPRKRIPNDDSLTVYVPVSFANAMREIAIMNGVSLATLQRMAILRGMAGLHKDWEHVHSKYRRMTREENVTSRQHLRSGVVD